jgi:hypothetical protein
MGLLLGAVRREQVADAEKNFVADASFSAHVALCVELLGIEAIVHQLHVHDPLVGRLPLDLAFCLHL